jgi:hypothetical protein
MFENFKSYISQKTIEWKWNTFWIIFQNEILIIG